MNIKKLSFLLLLLIGFFVIGVLIYLKIPIKDGNKTGQTNGDLNIKQSTVEGVYKLGQDNMDKNIETGFGIKGIPGNYKDISYQIKGNTFAGKFIIDNRSAKSYEYGILLLADYKQTNFKVNETKTVHPGFLLVRINPGEKREIEFETFIPDGKHSLSSVLIWEPNKTNNKDGPIGDIVDYKRITVIANNNMPEKKLNKSCIKSMASTYSNILTHDEIELVKTKNDIKADEINIWLLDSISKEDKTISFNIALSNVPLNKDDVSKKDFAIIGILNGKQVPLIIDNQRKLIHYGTLNAKEQVTLCAEIEAQVQNVSNFYLLLVNRPFEELRYKGEDYNEYYIKYSLGYSNRVTLKKG